MASVRLIRTSFVGGEVSPELVGRLDVDKVMSGLALCRNFVVLPHGPVQNRAGLAYCASTKYPGQRARLLPFAFSNSQTFCIELGAGYFRFFTLGAWVLTPTGSLLTNGSFTSDISSWTVSSSGSGATVAWDAGHGGQLALTSVLSGGGFSMAFASVYQAIATAPGSTYTVQVTASANISFRVGTTAGASDLASHTNNQFYGIQTFTTSFVATSSTSYLTLISETPADTEYVESAAMYVGAAVPGSQTPYEVANSYALSDLFDIHYVQSGDVITLVHPSYPPMELARVGAVNWSFATIAFQSGLAAPAGVLLTVSYPGGGYLQSFAYQVTALDTFGEEESLPGMQSGTTTKTGTFTRTLSTMTCSVTSHGLSTGSKVSMTFSDAGYNGNYTVTVTNSNTFTITTFDFIGAASGSLTLTLAGTANKNDLTVAGSYNTVSWTASNTPGVAYYNIYKAINGGQFGFVAQVPASSLSWIDKNVTPDMTQTPPMQDPVFASAGNYPGAVGYYEQRRFFGGTNNQPESLWGTQPGTQSNMDYSVPSQASDALRVTIAAQRANFVRHIVALLDMVCLTASTEWRVYSDNGNALTPTTITIKAQWQNGASNVQPVVVNNACLYASSQGGHVRALSYEWTLSGYKSEDLCLLARHLFDFHTIVDMAFQRSPYPILWALSDTGVLLGLSYLPDQQVQAWHQHTTQGTIESICVVAENGFDVLYAIVNRTVMVAGVATPTRFVERVDARNYAGVLANAFFVDCGATYTAPSGTFSLAGMTVTCAVLGHGLTNGSSYQFVFGQSSWSGTFTLSGNMLTCAVVGHNLTAGGRYALVFSDGSYSGNYVVQVVDANTFSVLVPVVAATSGSVSFTGPSLYNGTHTVAVVDADHFTFAVAVAGDVSGTVQQQVTSVSGLSWLVGQGACSVLADGVVHPAVTVSSGGSIALSWPASVVTVGLPYTSTLETLPVGVANDSALGQGRVKAVNQIWARCVDFTGCWVGSSGSARRVKVAPLGFAADGVTPVLTNGEFRKTPWPGFDQDGGVVIENRDPVPLTVVEVTFEVVLGGG